MTTLRVAAPMALAGVAVLLTARAPVGEAAVPPRSPAPAKEQAGRPMHGPRPAVAQQIAGKAGPLCDKAVEPAAAGYSTPPTRSVGPKALAVVYRAHPPARDWNGHDLGPSPLTPAPSVEAVQVVLCLAETLEKVGVYERTKEPGYRVDLSAALMRWPDGKTLAAKRFGGGDPPGYKEAGGPGYGTAPGPAEIIKWIVEGLDDPEALPHASVSAVAFSPDGSLLASSGGAGILLWDWRNGKTVATLDASLWSGMAFLPDGTLAVAREGGIRILEMPSGTERRTLPGRGRAAVSLAVDPGGSTLAAASTEGAVTLWDLGEAKPRHVLPAPTPARFHSTVRLGFSPDGRRLATIGGPNAVRIWDVATGEPRGDPVKNAVEDVGIVFTPDGTLVSGGYGSSVRFWNGDTLAPIRSLNAPTKELLERIAVSADGKAIAAGDAGGAVWLWTLSPARPVRKLGTRPAGITALAFAPDGRTLAVAANHFVKIYDLSASGGASAPRR